jgi:hypothetical protein
MERCCICGDRRRHHGASSIVIVQRSKDMGKYFLAWILGVPGVVLVLIYILMH